MIPSASAAQYAANQLLARQNVAPLVAASHLDGAVVVLRQVEEVVGLQQHVAELGERDAVFALFQPGAHRVALDHLVDRKMLADVAQEIHQVQGHQPIGIVQHERPVVRRKIEEPAQLHADPGAVLLGLLFCQQGSLGALAAGIADQAGPAAHQHQRPVAMALGVGQRHHGNEAAEVEAVGRRIEADVHGAASLAEKGVQVVAGHGLQEAAPTELLEEHTLAVGGHRIGKILRGSNLHLPTGDRRFRLSTWRCLTASGGLGPVVLRERFRFLDFPQGAAIVELQTAKTAVIQPAAAHPRRQVPESKLHPVDVVPLF